MGIRLKARGKLIAPIALLVVTMVGAIVLVSNSISTEQFSKLAYADGKYIAKGYGNQISTWMSSVVKTAEALSASIAGMQAAGTGSRAAYSDILHNVLVQNPDYLSVWSVWAPEAIDGNDAAYAGKPGYDATGRFIPVWSRALGPIRLDPAYNYETPGDGDYYLVPMKTLKPLLMEPYVYSYTGDPKDNKHITSVAIPIIVNGTAVGVVGIDLDLGTLQKLVNGIKIYGTGYGVLTSNTGVRIAHPNASLVGKPVGDDVPSQKAALLNAIRSGGEFTIVKHNLGNGTESYVVYEPVNISDIASPWCFAAVLPLSSMLSGVVLATRVSIEIGIGAIFLSILIIYLLSNIVVRPVKLTTRALNQFAEGDFRLAARDKHAIEVVTRRHDEFGESARSLVQMQASLTRTVRTIRAAAGAIASGSGQVSETADTVSHGASTQAASAEEVSASMEEMGATIRTTTDNAQATESISAKSAEDAQQGGAAVARSVEAMNHIAEKIVIVAEIGDRPISSHLTPQLKPRAPATPEGDSR